MKARLGALSVLLLVSPALATKVKIALVAPLSGPLGPIGESARLASELALQTMRAQLTKAGLEVTLVPIDEGNPTIAAQSARALVSDPEVLGVLGPTFSGTAMLVSDVLRPANLVMLSGAATATEITDRNYPNVNRVVARSDAQAAAMAEYLSQKTPHRKLMVISDATTYGNSLADDVETAAAVYKLNVVGRFNTTARIAFEDIVTAAKKQNPDVIYFSGGQEAGLALLRELRSANITSVFAGGSTFEDPSFIRTGQGLVKGVLYTTTFGPLNKFAAASAFSQRFKSAFNQNATIFSVFNYDATRVMLQALLDAKAGAGDTLSRADVSAAVRKVNIPGGLTGALSFNAKGDRQRAPLFVMRFSETTTLPEYLQIHIARPKAVK